MAWNYTPANIGSSGLSFVRWRIGDTSSGEQLLEDAEIEGALAVYGDKFSAAAASAEAVASVFSRRADTTMGKLSIAHSQKAEAYRELAKEIRRDAKTQLAVGPWAAAHSESRKETYEEDTDRVEPFFTRTLFDTPGVHVDTVSTG